MAGKRLGVKLINQVYKNWRAMIARQMCVCEPAFLNIVSYKMQDKDKSLFPGSQMKLKNLFMSCQNRDMAMIGKSFGMSAFKQ